MKQQTLAIIAIIAIPALIWVIGGRQFNLLSGVATFLFGVGALVYALKAWKGSRHD